MSKILNQNNELLNQAKFHVKSFEISPGQTIKAQEKSIYINSLSHFPLMDPYPILEDSSVT